MSAHTHTHTYTHTYTQAHACSPAGPRGNLPEESGNAEAKSRCAEERKEDKAEERAELCSRQLALQPQHKPVDLAQAKHAKGAHVFGGLQRLEADKGDLHAENGAEDVEGGVGNVDALVEASSDHEHEDVQGDEVDQEHVATPRRHLCAPTAASKQGEARRSKEKQGEARGSKGKQGEARGSKEKQGEARGRKCGSD